MSTETPLDLKKTVNLPKTDFAQKANLAQSEPVRLEKWAKLDLYRLIRHPREVHPARRPALRQRRHPSRHRDEQDSERLHREVAHDDGIRRALRARLRLPWPAHRTTSRTRAREKGQEEERSQHREFSSRLPRTR